MTISPFGKKDEPQKSKTKAGADDKAVGKPGQSSGAAVKPAPPSARAPESVPAPDDDLSLDFSHYVPPPRLPEATVAPAPGKPLLQGQKPNVAPAPAPGATPSGRIPVVTSPVAGRPDAPMPPTARTATPGKSPVPPSAPEGRPPASQPPVSTPGRPPDSILNFEVTAGRSGVAPIIGEAAILFANGQASQALAVLAKAVREKDLGPSSLQAWLMLFDLYHHLGMKADFELLALEFAVEFERSPPVWTEARPRASPALATGGIGYCGLTGVLSDASASQFAQLRRNAERQQALRIDFTKLQGLDAEGCTRLLEALASLKSSGKEVVFSGEANLLRLLEAECQTGTRETDGAVWSLLFEILRLLGLKDRFEEAAVNYAVTREMSPPSWATQAGEKRQTGANASVPQPVEPAYKLSGDVSGASQTLAKQLQEWAAANSPLVIDMSEVRRVDFTAAGQLLNILTQLHQGGATIQIRGANELVAALLGVMGIQQVGRIVRRS